MSFCLGNAIKYIWRADLKGNAIEDLQKARWYVDREIARLGGEPAVQDRLAADGRLLPEGGTVLTAEQVAEARELLDAVDLDAEEFHLLRAAFTPPAEPVPDSEPEDRAVAPALWSAGTQAGCAPRRCANCAARVAPVIPTRRSSLRTVGRMAHRRTLGRHGRKRQTVSCIGALTGTAAPPSRDG